MPAISAQAATINVPGFGNFDVPLAPEYDQQVAQANQALADHADEIKGFQQSLAAPQAIAPQAPNAAPAPNLFDQTQHTTGIAALDAARSKVGAQYVWGGNGPNGFDCSGLVKWAYKQAGIDLPRTSFEQSHVGKPVAFQELQPGDLIIQNGGGHVAMYAGDGRILHASQSGEPVEYAHLDPDSIVTARRVA
ncbi:cell wall-associated NlpC family hydrolase [Nocardia transvalensis]|uniref:Cell wall-associated NlpC family hydrolase n=1 Tax=Nocardia transvalensis TaxID=37333 RepID=A0A7W9UI47_9NOCA|nr:NlpC/P60 family protein [Nocardia transvalensis]MBB5913876.1 cell wall-associated NlpC family hydrolase [Nocardia transvalensis]